MHGHETPVAVVTGAGRARGIGRAIARRLARDGYAIVVHERSSEPARRTTDEAATGWLGARSVVDEIVADGGTAAAVSGDLLDTATIQQLRDAGAALGSLAVLVNNHGAAGEANSYMAHETPQDVWDETVAVNLTSLHRIGAVLIPALADSRAPRRSIVNLTSTAGHRALGRYGGYCAAKAAVERLTEQQALELARFGIRVNAVAPGLTPTDMIDGTLAAAAAVAGTDVETIAGAVRRRIPLRRFATADEVAAVVGFLAGPDADYVTGQIITVDGGMTLA